MGREELVDKASTQGSLMRVLIGQTAMGAAGSWLLLLLALIDPSHITSLIAHNPEPETTALILVSFFALISAVGAALTGMMLIVAGRP
jgi:hypothetical protein